MKKLLIAAVATVAFMSAASADYVDRESGALVLENVYGQDSQPVSEIARGCGIDHSMNDPDPSIRTELMRDCAAGGPLGGGTGD